MAVGGSNRGALSFFSLSAWVRDGRGGRAVRHAVDAILACQDLDPPPSSLPWRRLDPPPSSLPWRRLYPDSSRRREAVAAPPRRNLRLLLRDAAEDDEAVAASALKSLGFALYHPVLVSTISGQLAQSVLATLVRLIMTTKMKAICNLAVWCISVQQLEASVVEDGVTPLLNGIVYALDNPFGSLSTTFEAVQD